MSKIVEQQVRDLEERVAVLERRITSLQQLLEGRALDGVSRDTLKLKRG
jgi:hypothetical protein